MLGQLGLADLEYLPPFPDGRPGFGGKRNLAGDLLLDGLFDHVPPAPASSRAEISRTLAPRFIKPAGAAAFTYSSSTDAPFFRQPPNRAAFQAPVRSHPVRW